jgi:RimJ/RimL family protein N-acetyltransferase
MRNNDPGGPGSRASLEELLALDILTLREHTEQAGDKIDEHQHADRLRASLLISHVCQVRRHGKLVAYAMLSPDRGDRWLVRAFNIRPQYRTSVVMLELLRATLALVERVGITELRSNVYKTNVRSIAFHKRLGFRVTRESDKGIEFVGTVAELESNISVAQIVRRLRELR